MGVLLPSPIEATKGMTNVEALKKKCAKTRTQSCCLPRQLIIFDRSKHYLPGTRYSAWSIRFSFTLKTWREKEEKILCQIEILEKEWKDMGLFESNEAVPKKLTGLAF